MSKITRLADKCHDSKRWSPIDALHACIEDIEKGEIKPVQLAILYLEETDDKRVRPGQYVVNMSYAEHIAFLVAALLKAHKDWSEH